VSDFLTVLPLAVVMIAGPQIVSAVFFATSDMWARTSTAYVLGAAVSITGVATAAYFLADKAKGSGGGERGDTIDIVILVLLVVLAVYTFLKRKESEPPKWMGRLEGATPRLALVLGFLLLGFFPSDLITSVTVGGHIARDGDPWWHILGFVLLSLLLLALPAILVLLLGRRAKDLLPKAREWMNTNSWIISELVIALFIVIEINSLASS